MKKNNFMPESILQTQGIISKALEPYQRVQESVNASLSFILEGLQPSLSLHSDAYAQLLDSFSLIREKFLEAFAPLYNPAEICHNFLQPMNELHTSLDTLISQVYAIEISETDIHIPPELCFDKHNSFDTDEPPATTTPSAPKKLSFLEASSYIIGLIGTLISIISFLSDLQSEPLPTRQQMQEHLNNQERIIELLEENNQSSEQANDKEQLQSQIDALAESIDYLSSVLSDIQIILESNAEPLPDCSQPPTTDQ